MKKLLFVLVFLSLVGISFAQESKIQTFSTTVIFTNGVTIDITPRHINPFVLKSFSLVFTNNVTNAVSVYLDRALSTNETITVNLFAGTTNTYQSMIYYFDNDFNVLKDDSLRITNTASDRAIFIYNFAKPQ